MFTKIPTDQFFHQHTHFSAAPPKTKSTTKIPKTTQQYTSTPYSMHPGRGSGGGRPKQNRPKNQNHRLDEAIPNSGSGGSSNNKKNKKHRNGNKQQRQQQQQKQDMQQIRGHSYNLSNPKNSTNLNSSRQNLDISQHSLNNHTTTTLNKQHNNHQQHHHHHHPPPNHQVRHHHNDPNKVARRQQHDQKQKTNRRQRVRPSPSAAATASAETTTPSSSSSSSSSSSTLLTTLKTTHSTKPQYDTSSSTSYAEINPTSVVQQISTDASANRNTLTSTVVVTKRKGRRRKNDKIHKKGQTPQKKHNLQHSAELTKTNSQNWNRSYSTSSITSATLPSYDEDEFMSSSTDYAWINNDILLASSVKPTSASLPTWETWYPSSSSTYSDEDTSDYTLGASSVTTSSFTKLEEDVKGYSTTPLESSSMTDIATNALSLQTSLPLPTSAFTTFTQTEDNIQETMISPTTTVTTTDLGTTTTNTSNYSQTDTWSTTTLLDNDEDGNSVKSSMFATPKLEDAQDIEEIESYFDSLNNFEFIKEETADNATSTISNTMTEDGTSSATETSTDESDTTAYTTLVKTTNGNNNNDYTSEMISSRVVTTPTLLTYSNDCANSTASLLNGSKTMTDCLNATRTANIANNHKNSRPRNNSFNTEIPKRYFIQTKESKWERNSKSTTTATSTTTTSNTLDTTPLRKNDKTTRITTSLPESSLPSSSSPSSSATLAMSSQFSPLTTTAMHVTSLTTLNNDKTAEIIATPTASSSTSSTKSLSLTPSMPTRKTLRKSTQRLLATPFHQLTYVRNEAGDIDIDSIDNISIYPELLDNDNNDETVVKPSTSRLTMISGYLPTSATAAILPESIRIAKIKINRERRRMLRLRNVGNYA